MGNFEEEDDDNNLSPKKDNGKKTSKTPVLDNFGKNLTRLAEEGKLDPVYGRTDEVLRVAQILTRRKKNNPIIIGSSGVGKTSIAILLAQMIADKLGKELKYEIVSFHASRPGHDLRYALDGAKLESYGYSYPVSFEESLTDTINWYKAKYE